MVDKINGTWKMVTSNGFDDYMKALGRQMQFNFDFWERLTFLTV